MAGPWEPDVEEGDGAGGHPPPGAAREAGCIAAAGGLLFPVLAWGFAGRFGMSVMDALYLSALLGLLPALAVAQVPLAEHAPVDRMGAYVGSGALLTVLGVAGVLLGREGPGLLAMGLGEMPMLSFLGWTGALLGVAAALQAAFLALQRAFGWRESSLLLRLLPRTPREKRAFAGVSLLAGLGEEIAFRGFAIPVLAPLLGGAWPAALFTSVTFGLLHAYQGAVGIVRTGLFGVALAAAFLLSGSLWPAVAAHFVLDLVVGVWLAERWIESG